ncbi:MAG: biopolymer transporter ExbD [Deltaproteobacteria bacterium]|nr:biopolymer transporter ExbD [Deltaproteobacteria bacterium]
MGLSRNGPEINVTPLIDVLLVLLVIFLVVLPAMLRMEQVEVPREGGPDVEPLPSLTIKVHADLGVSIEDEGTEVQLAGTDLPATLRSHLRQTVHVVFVQFDDHVPWRDVVSTIDTIHGVATDTHVALRIGCDSDCDHP